MRAQGRPKPLPLWTEAPALGAETASGAAPSAPAAPLAPAPRPGGPYAAVAVDLGGGPDDQLFTYAVPAALALALRPGHRVLVPFAGRRQPVPGVVFALEDESAWPAERLRVVQALLDPEPVLGADDLALARFLAERTCCGLGHAVGPLLPPGAGVGVRARTVPAYYPHAGATGAEEAALQRAPRQLFAWQVICAAPGSTQAELTDRGCAATAVAALVRRGWVERRAAPVRRDPFAAELAAGAGPEVPPPLTPEQEVAVAALVADLGGPARWLLYGVTGSGKTEVYLQVIARVLARGRQALVLVPEIALTPQTVGRFRARFGAAVAVLHSGLGAGERYDEWWRIRRGEVAVAVGARSAVFAPFQRLGLIVLDEEHESSYRQDEAPRYHARDVALWRGARLGIPVVLGSATPDLGSFAASADGGLRRLDLTRRALDRPMPSVRIVDRRHLPAPRLEGYTTPAPAWADGSSAIPRRADGARVVPAAVGAAVGAVPTTDLPEPPRAAATPMPGSALLTPELCAAISKHLDAAGQVLLFLNRRGFAPLLLCGGCGFTARCQACEVSLCYHEAERALRCHYCGARRPVPRLCPRCGGAFLWLKGSGTERVAADVMRLWPRARVLRMDLDTTAAKGAHRVIYEAFRAGEADVLVGTQMVAKGWDVAGVTLVGVIDADTALHRADYRGVERTFQLLCQVAGRAGRGTEPGEVIVQTYCPDHPAVVAAITHDYRGFAVQELAARRAAGFPPFAHLVRLLAWAPRAVEAEAGAQALAAALRAGGIPPGVDLWGPGEAPLSRLRGQYRWQLALRGPDGAALRALAAAAYRQVVRRKGAAQLAIDPDPLSML